MQQIAFFTEQSATVYLDIEGCYFLHVYGQAPCVGYEVIHKLEPSEIVAYIWDPQSYVATKSKYMLSHLNEFQVLSDR
jgi:pyrimidine deaminase RibD-like protein